MKEMGEIIGCGPCTKNERMAILYYIKHTKKQKLPEKDNNDLKSYMATHGTVAKSG